MSVNPAMPVADLSPLIWGGAGGGSPADLANPVLDLDDCRDLLEHLSEITDPRGLRGVRHAFVSILAIAVAAVLGGARSFTAIGQWADEAPGQVLTALGVRSRRNGQKEDLPWVQAVIDPLAGQQVPIDESNVIDLWNEHGLTETLQRQATRFIEGEKVRTGPRYPDRYPILIELSVMRRRKDGRIDLPDVYRIAFSIGRRGACRKSRHDSSVQVPSQAGLISASHPQPRRAAVVAAESARQSGAASVIGWKEQLHVLAQRHTVYVVDLPGQGYTRLKDRAFHWDLGAMTGAIGDFMDVRDTWSWEIMKYPVVGELFGNLRGATGSTYLGWAENIFVHRNLVTPELVDELWASATFHDNLRAMYLLERGLDWGETESAGPVNRLLRDFLWATGSAPWSWPRSGATPWR
ncbi:hypothetical protein FHR32_002285 [Streptosporangium album]|uniref:H repeat-associated protein N-terminal domain-containing protein n=1 Tax=Streptosporangium album TaxID=47479 RepID=A0A7W7W9F2_9ACTN|nr:transposase family protein [Streptosporangium album]MBB4937980.1 hypothetical protein [Streptosporangium album]